MICMSNSHPLGAVFRYRDPQFKADENNIKVILISPDRVECTARSNDQINFNGSTLQISKTTVEKNIN